uniref:NADH dehydrogenase subunit 6 n=2 Tax=Bathymodiolus TaxID=12965 RepID=A0A8A2F2Q9_BATMI|nr:NADH dehydrogenase subunit 6 [Bathymodiolus marisindicus]WIW39665.1 NADH dehydrogenase subunit 6 [Bathymodiolus septemdierum]QSV10381.1 NADH dehydrogenase subunit 6 [Bathymodiolus marisindicus]WIW39691.1 NADH dehydrogenase subunit 6 [Bathymodiolus septemdierum]WIW39717.1 NADH dehydrogenase subunit 6 [Bathymodiolus septemdierum]WIW39730.1 NADH dehydrogenase subunit 6 [Bathymodiolus septemdierum]
MLETFLFSVSSLVCCFMLSISEPLFMGLSLFAVSFAISVLLGLEMSSLVGYFVFLIYIGGLMVLFGYVLSIFPNQRFGAPVLFVKLLLVVLVGFVVVFHKNKGESFVSLGDFGSCLGSGNMYLFVAVLLLFVLLLVVAFCKKRRMPLRMVWE